MEKFIPKERIDRSKTYPGYLATSRGLIHESIASARHDKDGTLRFRPIYAPMPPGLWDGVQPNRKRTPQERIDSLSKRIQHQNKNYAMPASVFIEAQSIVDKVGREGVSDGVLREIQALAAKGGQLMSMEDVRAIARIYITDAEKKWNAEQDKRVTRKSPYVLDTPAAQQI